MFPPPALQRSVAPPRASVASLLFHSTGRPSITERARGTDSLACSRWSNRAKEGLKEREGERQRQDGGYEKTGEHDRETEKDRGTA